MDTILSPRRRQLVVGLGLGALAGCGRPPAPAARSGYASFGGSTMGSTWTVKLAAAEHAMASLQAVVQSALDAVDQQMSIYRPESELSQFNRAGAGSFALSDDLALVLAAAGRFSAWSGGAFDVTVAPLVEEWGFGVRGVRRVPSAAKIAEGRRRVDWRALTVDAGQRQAVKALAGLQADLGGIAKGYGVDRAVAALEARGVRHYMVEAGGEVRTRGVNASGEPWRIGIEQPDALPQQARWAVPLSGLAMATSGDYRNYFVEDGRRYSHEIDPVAGEPVRNALASVTVVADDCLHADAMATALIVMGPERGRALAESTGIAAHFIERRPDGTLRDAMTPAFTALRAERA
jgi:thiamine biosynthesis lipoprotein